MYAVQIHTLELVAVNNNEIQKPRNLFLDISSEGQRPRRYFMGAFSKPSVRSFESIVHFTNSAVTLNLNYGPFRYHFLGVHTVYEFLDNFEALKNIQYLTFGRRGKSPLFKLSYSVSLIQCAYRFLLNEVTCLKQISSAWRQDDLYADVEFNHSIHSIDHRPRNRYELGRFVSYDISSVQSIHNFSFSTLTNFVITFGVKSLFSDYILSTFKFTPLQEMLNNIRFRQQTRRKNKNNSNNLTDMSTSNNTDTLDSNTYNNNNNNGGQTQQQMSEDFEEECQLDSDNVVNLQTENIGTTTTAGLLFTKYDSEGTSTKFIEMDINNNETITHRITISSPEGGTYELLFSLSLDKESLVNYSSIPKKLWSPRPNTNAIIVREDKQNSSSQSKFSSRHSFQSSEVALSDFSSRSEDSENKSNFVSIDSRHFSLPTFHNYVEILIDGKATFKRYYELMMRAEHSISILAWELSLGFGLILARNAKPPLPSLFDPTLKWITLEDVLLSKAKEGVKIRIIVWRHELLSHLNRFLYLGEITVEREVAKLERRCKKIGLNIRVFHTIGNMPEVTTPYADPFNFPSDVHILVIIAGNPKGLISCHHEKLLLIDAECPQHTVAFTGGFDIARGRYDEPSHPIPKTITQSLRKVPNLFGMTTLASTSTSTSSWLTSSKDRQKHRHQTTTPTQNEGTSHKALLKNKLKKTGKEKAALSGRIVQQTFPIRFLWHDIQLLIKGPATQLLHLHFAQRWIHLFSQNPNLCKNLSLQYEHRRCHQHREFKMKGPHRDCQIRLERTWKGVFEADHLFDDYIKAFQNAKHFLYIEHQYPFENFTLTHCLCEALKMNKNLKVIIVTAIKTDLPTGLVGELFDWSQDHIIEHLQLIYSTAPDRVGVYGLLRQDPASPDQIKPIYVHTKLIIVDDEYLITGSTNMDNVSFFYSTELSVEIHDKTVAQDTRRRLLKEHLENHYTSELDNNFEACFQRFQEIATINQSRLDSKKRSARKIRNTNRIEVVTDANVEFAKYNMNQLKKHSENEPKMLEKSTNDGKLSRNTLNEPTSWPLLVGRPVFMVPEENYHLLLRTVYYPNKLMKLFTKIGLGPNLTETLTPFLKKMKEFLHLVPKL